LAGGEDFRVAYDNVFSISVKAQTGDARSGLNTVTDGIREIKPASQEAQALLCIGRPWSF
jgi:hypothetical protein